MIAPIEEWWPHLGVELRRWIVNNLWSPMHGYAREEIQRSGGPSDADEFWQRWDDGSLLLPQEAVRWIIAHPDSAELRQPVQDDPRARYFQRQHWPYR